MYNATTQFKNCMKELLRNRAHIQVDIGIVNSLAQSNARIVSHLTDWSNERSVWNKNTVETQYATFEENQWKADGSQYILPEPDVDMAPYNTNVGVVSRDILEPIRITFTERFDLKGLTINFGEFYPTKFTVTVNGGTFTYTNDSPEFETNDTYGLTNEMIITPISMVGGQQRLRIESIVMGVGFVFKDDSVEKCETSESISFISDEISNHTFTLTAFDTGNNFNVDDSNSFINYLNTGQTINCMVGLDLDDDTIEWIQLGVFYLNSWSREGMTVKLNASDRLSFFTDTYSDGNYIHTRTLYDDIVNVLTYEGLDVDEYKIDDCLQDITISNPLPSVTVAQALQLLCNAGRCVCFQNREGVIQVMANFSNIVDPEDITVTTISATDYSHTSNILTGTTEVYADFTNYFFSADGSMFILPESGNDYSRDTGFVSSEIADMQGNFVNNPSITFELPASFVYYGFNCNFDGNPPQEMIIKTYNDDAEVSELTVTDLKNENYIPYTFKRFDKLVITFTKAEPLNRVLINKFSFSDLSDYKLTFNDILDNLKGIKEKKIKKVRVKQYTFTQPATEGELPQQKDDGVFFDYPVSDVGEEVTLNNQLISTPEHAQLVAEWLGNYYANNISYSCNYRGDPTLNATDIIHLESELLSNLQVEIEKHRFTYNGAFGGSLDMRRALRMIE